VDITNNASNMNSRKHTLKNGSFFQNLNLNLSKGKIHIITGEIGSGKSALLNVFLNELYQISGELRIAANLRIEFCSQDPWIIHETIRNNIVLQNTFDQDKYNQCIELTQLNNDLKEFPLGDQVEIGDNGVNLSGGQKSRVQLCRAI